MAFLKCKWRVEVKKPEPLTFHWSLKGKGQEEYEQQNYFLEDIICECFTCRWQGRENDKIWIISKEVVRY